MEDREPAELADSIIGADRPAEPSEVEQPPNAAMGPLGLLLYPYRRVLLLPMLVVIAVLIVVSLVR